MSLIKAQFLAQTSQNQDLAAQILEHAKDGLCVYLKNKPAERWFSDGIWRQLGRNPATVTDTDWSSKIFPTQQPMAGYRFVGIDGIEYILETKASPDSGTPELVVEILKDISTPSRQADALARTQRRLREMLYNLGDQVYVLDAGFVVKEYVHNKIDHFFQSPAEQIVGKHLGETGLPQSVLMQLIEGIHQAKVDGASSGIEYTLAEDGRQELYSASVSVLRTEEGGIDEIIVAARKITSLREAELKLHELAMVAAKTTDFACITDASGKITWLNQAMLTHSGHSMEDLKGQFLADVHNGPETGPKCIEAFRKALKTFQSFSGALLKYTSSGQKYWADIQLDPVFNEAGHCSHFICIERDITLRRQEEEELALTKEMLLDTNRTAKIGGWSYDAVKDIVYWSDVTREIHEVDADFEPTVPKVIEFYKDGESRQRYYEAGMNAVQQGIPYDVELKIVTAKGNEVWVRTIGKVDFENGVCKRLYGTFQNIDHFKFIENELKESSALLRKLADHVPGALYQYVRFDDGSHSFLYFSGGIFKIIGVTSEELLIDPGAMFSLIHPDDMELLNQTILHSYHALERWEMRFRVVLKDGTIKQLHGISSPEKEVGKVVWHGILQEITGQ